MRKPGILTTIACLSAAGVVAPSSTLGDTPENNKKALETLAKQASPAEATLAKVDDWARQLKAEGRAPTATNRQKMERLLLGVLPDDNLQTLFEEAEKSIAHPSRFEEAKRRIIRAIERWKGALNKALQEHAREFTPKSSAGEARSIAPVSVWETHENKSVRALDFNPKGTGRYLEFASAGGDNMVVVRRWRRGMERGDLEETASNTIYVKAKGGARYLKYGGDGRWIVTRDGDSKAYRWATKDLKQGDKLVYAQLRMASPTRRPLSALCVGKEGNLYYGYDIKTAVQTSVYIERLIKDNAHSADTSNDKEKPIFTEKGLPNDPIFKMCLNDAESVLAAATTTRIYFAPTDLSENPVAGRITPDSDRNPVDGVNAMVALKDERVAYSLYNDKRVLVFDKRDAVALSANPIEPKSIEFGEHCKVLDNPLGREIVSLVYDAKHQLLIGGEYNEAEGEGGRLVVWNMADETSIAPTIIPSAGNAPGAGHRRTVWSLAISPGGKWLLSGGSKGEICLWDLEAIQRYVENPPLPAKKSP